MQLLAGVPARYEVHRAAGEKKWGVNAAIDDGGRRKADLGRKLALNMFRYEISSHWLYK